MKVLIAGATGALGIPLVRALIAGGHEVLGLSRTPEKSSRLATLGAQPILADVMGEVGGRRGAVHSSDLPEISSGGFMETALFQPPLPEPAGHLSMQRALQACDLVCLDCLSPCGSRPPPHSRGRSPSPAALPRVLGITPGI